MTYTIDGDPVEVVASENERRQAWLDALLDALPPAIRPSAYDGRFRSACAAAYEHGWPAIRLAELVAAVDYTRTHNPPLVAIMHLERIGERPPPQARPTAPRTQAQTEAHCGRPACSCAHQDCYRGWIDSDGPTAPCPACRPALTRRLNDIPPPGRQRTTADLAHLRDRDDWR